jgi:tetratricopeptide (TPR) repeat protein
MSIGEILSRLVLKRLIDDVFATGGAETLDAVTEFLTRCGRQSDPRLTAALEQGLENAWRALEVALADEPFDDDEPSGLAAGDAQSLRRHLEMVLVELVQGRAGASRPGATAVAHALRRQCLRELRAARETDTLAGCLDTDEWARSQEVLARFSAAQGRRDTRRRTEGQLIRELEQQGHVGLMRVLTAGAALPLLVTAARAFVCRELGRLLYHCLQECPEQTPNNCAVVLSAFEELSIPRFSIWRSAVPARTAARMTPPILAVPRLPTPINRRPRRPNRRRSTVARLAVNNPSPVRRLSWLPPSPPRSVKRAIPAMPRSTVILWGVLTLAALLLLALPIWIVLTDVNRQAVERRRADAEHRRLLEERRRLAEEHRQLVEEQRRIAAAEAARRRAEERRRQEEERRRLAEAEEARHQAEQRALRQREEERKRREEERLARIRAEKERLEKARAAFERGLTHAALGRDKQAAEAFNEALTLNPGLDRAWGERGLVRRRLGDDTGALDDFAEAVKRDPRDVRAWINRGELHQRRGDYNLAVEDFTAVLRLRPNNARAYRARGVCYTHTGAYAKAVADETAAITLAPHDPWPYYYRANAHRLRDHTGRALDDYTAAIDRDRNEDRELAPAYRARGMIYLDRKEYDRAIADLTRALECEPADMDARLARGLAHLKSGAGNKALLDADAAIARDPGNVEAHKLRGQAHLALGEPRKAHKDFSKAIKLHRDAEAYYGRARARAALGDFIEAVYDCNSATAINPRLADAFFLRGTLRLQGGNLARGLADRRKAHNLDPRLPLP